MIYIGSQKTATASSTSIAKPGASSPLAGLALSDAVDGKDVDDEGRHRRRGLSSRKLEEDGAILGRLGFADADRGAPRLVGAEDGPSRPEVSGTDEPESGHRDIQSQVLHTEERKVNKGDEMEVFESPGRKNRFWKGKGRGKRASKAMSDVDDDVQVRRFTRYVTQQLSQ